MLKSACLLTIISLFIPGSSAQFYEDKRCKCICPSVGSILNKTLDQDQKLFIAYVPPNLCTCDYIILPKFAPNIKGYEQEICSRCECKYQMRNTAVIFVVVVLVIWMITLLMVYMVFLTCLDPLARRKTLEAHNFRREEVQNLLSNVEDDE